MGPHRQANADKLRHERQVAKLEQQVEALREQLRRSQRMAGIGTMAAMVAHEFNNILTPLIGYAHLAQKNPALRQKAVEQAARGGEQAQAICKAIMGLARQEADEPTLADVGKLIGQTLAAMGRDPDKDAIDLSLQAPRNLMVRTRPVELQQVLLNLLLNARRAVITKDDRRCIKVTADRQGGRLVLRVADNGVGIPSENLARIFEPFFTTNDADDGQCHGLGLAVCREIVESLGGDISVHSQPGRGTTFTVELPMAA